MDKKSIIGLVLIGLIMFGYTWYSGKQAAKYQAERVKQDSVAFVEAQRELAEAATQTIEQADQTTQTQSQEDILRANIGNELYAAQTAETQTFTLANEVAEYEFSTRGGQISEVTLLDYTKYGGEPLKMFVPDTERFNLEFFIQKGFKNIELQTANYNFECIAPGTEWAEGEETKEVRMRLAVDSTAHLDYVYTIYRDNYMLDFDIDFSGVAHLMASQYDFEIVWKNSSPQQEKGFENENNYTTVAYRFPGDRKPEELGIGKEGTSKSEKITSKIEWVAFKQQFFSSILVAKDDFQDGEVGYATYKPYVGMIKDFSAVLGVPYSPEKSVYSFQWYFGPNKFNLLEKYDLGFEYLVPLGGSLVGWINRWFVIPLFDFLSKYIASFGWIILIMTIIIKLVIFPLTYKSYQSSAKMRVLKPEIDALNEKYPRQEDAMKKQQAIMDLYKKADISPMSGCIPMLIQLPILWAMFRFFPASIELRGEKLWWADDLSSYDSIINLPFNIPFYGDHVSLFALLMSAMLVISSLINMRNTGQQQMPGMKFMMVWMMPIMMLFFMNNYASGLCYYYTLSSFITLLQMFAIRAMIDDNKVRAKMAEAAKKPRKKSKFQQRYEEALKAQQAQLREQQRRNGR
ncbi:MAG: membrane protein insertase YidC [Rikenellaceae bacterium]|nr:membrane protein insertase YidC [Rikenellaceae bacterium]